MNYKHEHEEISPVEVISIERWKDTEYRRKEQSQGDIEPGWSRRREREIIQAFQQKLHDDVHDPKGHPKRDRPDFVKQLIIMKIELNCVLYG